jgi:hypothetical protein
MTNAEATTTDAPTVGEQGAPKGHKRAKGGKAKASPQKEAKAGKKAKPAPANEASAPRAESKGARILEMIGWPKGATLADPLSWALPALLM